MSSSHTPNVNSDRSGDKEAAGDTKAGQDGRSFTEKTTREKPSKEYYSCAGCLYYSESFRAAGKNPFCVGITRNLGTLHQSQVATSRANDINQVKAGDFRYGCIGYTTFTRALGDASSASGTQSGPRASTPVQLPLCTGLEVLITDSSRAPNASSGGEPPAKHSPYPPGSREDAAYHAELARARRQASLTGPSAGTGAGKEQDTTSGARQCDGRQCEGGNASAGADVPGARAHPAGSAPAHRSGTPPRHPALPPVTSATTSAREAERQPPGQPASVSNAFSARLARSSAKILRRLVVDINHLGTMVKQGVESVVSGGGGRGPGSGGGGRAP
eukprot:jgi/Mesvir1/15988/Mv08293-RA.1